MQKLLDASGNPVAVGNQQVTSLPSLSLSFHLSLPHTLSPSFSHTHTLSPSLSHTLSLPISLTHSLWQDVSEFKNILLARVEEGLLAAHARASDTPVTGGEGLFISDTLVQSFRSIDTNRSHSGGVPATFAGGWPHELPAKAWCSVPQSVEEGLLAAHARASDTPVTFVC